MATASIRHKFPDGTITEMQVSTLADGPDALDECVIRVRELWHECVGDDADDG